MEHPVLYIVIPCYNEQEVLPITAPMFLNKLKELSDTGLISENSRVLFVNDGSADKTWDIICSFAQSDEHCIGISQSRNRGHQNAVLAGLMEAKDCCDISISIDCDGQDDINAMDDMVREYLNGCDIVYGVRCDRESDSFFKRTTAQGFYRFLSAMGADIVYNHADYRLISARALKELARFEEVNLFLRGMVPLVGFKSTSVEYKRTERLAGKSKYPPAQDAVACRRRHNEPFDKASETYNELRYYSRAFELRGCHMGNSLRARRPCGCRLGEHDVHNLLCQRCAAYLHGHNRRIHRQDIYGNKAPPEIYNL